MVFTFGLLLCTLTLAYFSSRDEVTNKISASEGEIVLLEPKWYAIGMSDAKTLEPGMIIQKNPQVRNDSDDAVYVRMRIKIVDSDGKDITDEYRVKAILSAIYIDKSLVSEKAENDSPLLASDGSSSNPYFILEDGWYYYYDKDNEQLAKLTSGDTTEELFSYLKIPTLKEEYQYFNSDFSIEVEAQSISASIDATKTAYIISAFSDEGKQS